MKDIYFMGMVVLFLYSCVEHIMNHPDRDDSLLEGLKLGAIFALLSLLWPLALAAFIYEIRNAIGKLKS